MPVMIMKKAKIRIICVNDHINKIIDTFKTRQDLEKQAHVASIDEIQANDYYLNIPRYVDTFEEEAPIDLDEINRLLQQDNAEIEELEKEINAQLKLLGVAVQDRKKTECQ